MSNNKIILMFVGLMAVVTSIAHRVPTGIRNNNPLNLREYGIDWDGKIGVDNDGFIIFKTPEHGIRAATRVLNTYNGRGINTIENIINEWSPRVGKYRDGKSYINNTGNYIAYVSDKFNKPRDYVVKREDYPALLSHMIQFENGSQPYSTVVIGRGVDMAELS